MVWMVSLWKWNYEHGSASLISLFCCDHHLQESKLPPTLLVPSHSWEFPREASEIMYSFQLPVVIWDLVSRQDGQSSNPSWDSTLAPFQVKPWRLPVLLSPLDLGSGSKEPQPWSRLYQTRVASRSETPWKGTKLQEDWEIWTSICVCTQCEPLVLICLWCVWKPTCT